MKSNIKVKVLLFNLALILIGTINCKLFHP